MTASASVVEALAKYDADAALCPVRQNDIRSVEKCRKCGATQSDRCGQDHPYPVIDALRAALNAPHPAEQEAREAVIAGLRLVHGDMTPSQLERCDSDGHAQRIDAAIQLISALTQAAPDGWRPIETAPKDGAEIVAHDATTATSHVTYADQWGDWYDPDSHYYGEAPAFRPTHWWMPLPPAPPAQGAGG